MVRVILEFIKYYYRGLIGQLIMQATNHNSIMFPVSAIFAVLLPPPLLSKLAHTRGGLRNEITCDSVLEAVGNPPIWCVDREAGTTSLLFLESE